ncbi:hypothetical protein IKQ26_00425 [bacterium]|nr:hypothetical protein [bacterium]
MMKVSNIISALGNNNSIYPLLVRDCGIENVAKVTMTYKQNKKESDFIAKHAARERAVEEYGTSAVWLGGVPFIGFLADKIIEKKGFSSQISTELLKDNPLQSLETNISRFKNSAPDLVKDLEKVLDNKSAFKKLQVGKFLATTIIPIALMGFVLPRLNFNYTKKKLEETKKELPVVDFQSVKKQSVTASAVSIKSSKISFKGLDSLLGISNLQKMMILDGGLTAGRIRTARNKDEKAEVAFKMAGMCYLNYRAPKLIEKGLNKLTKRLFGINTELDTKILDNKEFISAVKNKLVELPKSDAPEKMLEFIETKPDSLFSKLAEGQKLVQYTADRIRDPRKYVDIKKLNGLKEAVEGFMTDSIESGSVEKYAKKALKAKSFNVIANVLISSFLLAVALPKVQFLFRKLRTNSNIEPGIRLENERK